MALAIFDLDNTLLAGDSDHAWGLFLVEKNIVCAQAFARTVDKFYEDYRRGELDIHAYQAYIAEPLQSLSLDQLQQLQQEFLKDKVEPIILPAAEALIEEHRSKDDYLLIMTATNHWTASPIAARLGVDHILATDIDHNKGIINGKIIGTPCFQEGKVIRLNHWLKDQKFSLSDAYFYSDSINDLPLLKQVGHPVAVNADTKLAAIAAKQGWRQLDLRTNHV